jgi:hypothetical protein
MEKAKRARTAETPKLPSLRLRLRAPYLYPDQPHWRRCCGQQVLNRRRRERLRYYVPAHLGNEIGPHGIS